MFDQYSLNEYAQIISSINLPDATLYKVILFGPLFIAIWILIYFFYFILLSMFMSIFFGNKWKQTSTSDRFNYFSHFYSTLHSSFSFLFALFGLFYSCSEPALSFFNSQECRHQPSNMQNWANIVSMGYFVVDLFASLLLIKKTNKLAI